MHTRNNDQLALWPDATFDGNRARHFRRRGWREGYYRQYMAGLHWQCRRGEAIERAGFQCEACGSYERVQVHHRTYEHLGDEQPGDLEVLCRACHERAHELTTAHHRAKVNAI